MRDNLSNLTDCYIGLAEALSEPPDWIAGPGRRWPLFEAAVGLAHNGNSPIRKAVATLADIPSDSLQARRHHYHQLFAGQNRPQLWLYESLVRDGRLVGPTTFAVEKTYRATGLEVASAELPDHASVELSFLAYLVQREADAQEEGHQWRSARRLFIKAHAGQWLPSLGNALAYQGGPVYGPIGCLLAAVLHEEMHVARRANQDGTRHLPLIPQPDMCNLCGFCVQVCPTQALAVSETDDATTLLLNSQACIVCERCVRICGPQAITIEVIDIDTNVQVLRESPRAHCLACQQPMVSEAELQAVAARLGRPEWLAYCQTCRSLL